MHPLTDARKIRIDANGRYRVQAGPYDPDTHRPRYTFQVIAPDDHTRRQVEDHSHVMGQPGERFWVWDIHNDSRNPVFIILSVDGEPVF